MIEEYLNNLQESVSAQGLPRDLIRFLLSNGPRKLGLRNELFNKQTKQFRPPKTVSDLNAFNTQMKNEQKDYLETPQEKAHFDDSMKRFKLFIVAADEGGDMHAYSFATKGMFFYSHESRKFGRGPDYKTWMRKPI